jgi:hypothetical protein
MLLPAAGRAMAQLILQRHSDIDCSSLGVACFRQGREHRETRVV